MSFAPAPTVDASQLFSVANQGAELDTSLLPGDVSAAPKGQGSKGGAAKKTALSST